VTLNGNWGRSRLSQDLPDSRERVEAINQFALSLSVPIFTSSPGDRASSLAACR
jgi:hypothetical protein